MWNSNGEKKYKNGKITNIEELEKNKEEINKDFTTCSSLKIFLPIR